MAKRLDPTPELLAGIVARIPEGFIKDAKINRRIKLSQNNRAALKAALDDGLIGKTRKLLYDPARMDQQAVVEWSRWANPTLPGINDYGDFTTLPIAEQIARRSEQIATSNNTQAKALFAALDDTIGYVANDAIDDTALPVLDELVAHAILGRYDGFVYDPLRISPNSMPGLVEMHRLQPVRAAMIEYLQGKPGHTAAKDELEQQFGAKTVAELLQAGGFAGFGVDMKRPPHRSVWVRISDSDARTAEEAAAEAVRIKDEDWQEALELTGDVLRPGARDGNTRRIQVVARSYTVNRAAKRIGVHQETIERALDQEALPGFHDPEGRLRIPAAAVEAAFENPEQRAAVTAFEKVKARDLAMVSGYAYSTIRRRLQRAKLSASQPYWGDVRGRWNLPQDYDEYQTVLEARIEEHRAKQAAEREAERRRIQEAREAERQRRDDLRARLVASFPTWRHEDRSDQHIYLHVGPPNSGKTHDALEMLGSAESGWYLAPLRLLAFEVFERLNRDGVFCNLLTGEEHIPIPGATITAATIEMFNPARSGQCIVIDEAQMLADSDRGWAWTRALMEAEAPEIHVIGPPVAHPLIEKMATAAALPLTTIEHKRLTPIEVAERHWPLDRLPPRTILVAFSRRMVLHLKSEIESMGRTVSVVYGALPPEVRRRQADRFASGETEICVATDAVGMGLNLPADNVCFYELEKYDGTSVRKLTPAEVQQIGGRAGRFGYSESGQVSTVRRRDLKLLRRLFHTDALELTHARVAPSVEDLQLIPGNLAEKLLQWSELQSIPNTLRGVISTTDLDERIALARMLTDAQVEQLGLGTAMTLINAPTRQSNRAYWLSCAHAILDSQSLPMPPPPPGKISDSGDLDLTENSIACADIYLWLSNRREFNQFGEDEPLVRGQRRQWSNEIDLALLRRIDTAKRCPECGTTLPVGYRYRLCDNCYANRSDFGRAF